MSPRAPVSAPAVPALRPPGHRFGHGAASVLPYLLEGRRRSAALRVVADGQNALADDRLRPRRRR